MTKMEITVKYFLSICLLSLVANSTLAGVMPEVKFTQMKDDDEEDYNFLTKHEVEHTKGTANRLLKALVELDQSLSGYKVTRLGHSSPSFICVNLTSFIKITTSALDFKKL